MRLRADAECWLIGILRDLHVAQLFPASILRTGAKASDDYSGRVQDSRGAIVYIGLGPQRWIPRTRSPGAAFFVQEPRSAVFAPPPARQGIVQAGVTRR